jgi:hypothetical protein
MSKTAGSSFHFIEETRRPKQSVRDAFGLPETVGPRDAWVEVDVEDGWRAALRLVLYGGQVVIGELRLFPADRYPGRDVATWRAEVLGVLSGPRVRNKKKQLRRYAEPIVDCPAVQHGVTARLLRQVPLGEHLRHARQFLADLKRTHPKLQSSLSSWGLPDTPAPATRSRGRTGRPDPFYARIASEYLDRIAAGSRRPVADVARKRGLADTVVRDAIHAARQRGLLTKGRQGRPGGALTPEAERLLTKPRRKR